MPTGEHLVKAELAEFVNDSKVKSWIGGLKKTSISGYRSGLFAICHGLGVSGTQLLEQADKDPKGLSVRVKQLVRNWDANGQPDDKGKKRKLKKFTLRYRVAAMNNFLQANEIEKLPLAGLDLKSGHPKPHPLLSWAEAQRVISLANPAYQPIYKLMLWGFDSQRFIELNNDAERLMIVKEQLKDSSKDFIKIDIEGRHGNESPFYLLIPRELAEALPVITINGEPEKHTWNIQANWRRALIRAGLPIDKEHGAHNLRSYWKTEATKRGLPEELRQHQLGHIVDQLNYQRVMQDQKWVEDEFRKAWAIKPVATKEELTVRDQKISELEAHNEELRKIVGEDLLEAQQQLQKHIFQLLKERKLPTSTPISKYPSDIKELQEQLTKTLDRLVRLGLVKPEKMYG